LIKPQFEVGRARIGKGGIVGSERDRQSAREEIAAWLTSEAGWVVTGCIESPIAGGDGNREFLVAARKP
jgi:23S rRNA (cytidine1920-2'-O)/16S rRNA (cytidine1409-2'-O)-methyltransferase